jgi:exo-beta-1,3-glucanase (GH17 family)
MSLHTGVVLASTFKSALFCRGWCVFVPLAASLLSACGGGGGSDQASTSAPNAQSALVESKLGGLTAPPSTEVEVQALVESLNDYRTDGVAAPLLLEAFDDYVEANGSKVPNWGYIPGAEFPGSSGTLVLGTVAAGARSGVLNHDLNCGQTLLRLAPTNCGKYVAMSRTFGANFDVNLAEAPQLAVRYRTSEPQNEVSVRITDISGQTLQYALPPHTLQTAAGSTWTNATVALAGPTLYFGGANNGQLQDAFKTVAVLSAQGTLTGANGSLDVDEIRLLPSGLTKYSLTGTEPVLTDGVITSLEGRTAVSARYYKVSATSMRLAREAGFSVARVDLFWETVERNGSYDFSIYEAVLQRLADQGMKALFILNYGHTDHGGRPVTSEQRAAFVAYARAATRFAKGRNVVAFEIWNEPDNATFWKAGDVSLYAQLLAETKQAVKSEDPSRKVVNGGPSWANLPYILQLAQTGALTGLDAFAVHGYRGTRPPETLANDMVRMRNILAANGLTTTIWNTEWGYSSFGTLDTSVYGDGIDARARNWQALMVLRSLLAQVALNLPLITMYELYDTGSDPVDPEANFGLLTAKLEPKPAYNAVKRFHEFTRNGNYQGLLADTPPNMHAMKWLDSGRTKYVVWADSNRKTFRLAVPSSAKVALWDGRGVAAQTVGDHIKDFEISLADGPVFVSF